MEQIIVARMQCTHTASTIATVSSCMLSLVDPQKKIKPFEAHTSGRPCWIEIDSTASLTAAVLIKWDSAFSAILYIRVNFLTEVAIRISYLKHLLNIHEYMQ